MLPMGKAVRIYAGVGKINDATVVGQVLVALGLEEMVAGGQHIDQQNKGF
jgi:hypothetical protein